MTSWKRLAAVGIVAAGLPAAMLLVGVWACGPDWEPEVFVPEHHPEKAERFADGHLGILQRGYYHADLVVAYRYLSGGKLTDTERRRTRRFRMVRKAERTTPAPNSGARHGREPELRQEGLATISSRRECFRKLRMGRLRLSSS
jgi:hypothetical protein